MYTHGEIVRSECGGATRTVREWEAGDCCWEERVCEGCGARLATPAKDMYRTPHPWAYEMGARESATQDLGGEALEPGDYRRHVVGAEDDDGVLVAHDVHLPDKYLLLVVAVDEGGRALDQMEAVVGVGSVVGFVRGDGVGVGHDSPPQFTVTITVQRQAFPMATNLFLFRSEVKRGMSIAGINVRSVRACCEAALEYFSGKAPERRRRRFARAVPMAVAAEG